MVEPINSRRYDSWLILLYPPQPSLLVLLEAFGEVCFGGLFLLSEHTFIGGLLFLLQSVNATVSLNGASVIRNLSG